MDVLKLATEWAKDEIFSSKFFMLFGILFLLVSVGFWQLAKTETAKAFIIPTLVASVLLLILGFGLVYSTNTKLKSFKTEYNKNANAFVNSEIARAQQTLDGYNNAVFKVIPIIIIVCALALIFIDKPLWRAISVTTIAMLTIIIFVDSTAIKRLQDYKEQLELVEKK